MGTITRNFANNILGTGEVDATDGVNGTIPATNVADASLNNVTSLPSSVGYAIKSVASDPPSLNAGEIFYNSTAGAFKALVNVSAWHSGTSLPTVGHQWGGAGIQTANVIFGGTSPAANAENKTYEFNGSGWSNGGNLNTGRTAISGAGTQTSALGAGGYLFPGGATQAETYDGSSWTSITSMPLAQTYSSTGTQTSALYVANPGAVLEYTAPSWTSGGSLGTPRAEGSTSGTQTSGLFFGGGPQTSASSGTEEYDGSTWTAGNNMNTARGIQIGGSGSQTASLAFGGAGPNEPAVSTATEEYDGTSWTTVGSLATARSRTAKGGAQGTTTANIAQGGTIPARTDTVELYNKSLNTTVAAAWASGGNLNTGRNNMFVFGTQDAAVGAAGYNFPPGQRAESEEYNGTSWTEGNNVNTARSSGAASGSLTAGIIYAGYTGSNTGVSETYDGTSYTEVNDLSTGRRLLAGSTNSPQATATAFGGFVTAASSLTEEYDGTNWTAGGTMSAARYKLGGAGTQTAALAFGGIPAPGGASQTATEEYGGTSWTSGGNLITAVNQNAGNGTQTAALSYGGTPNVTTTVGYDGTAWSTRPSLGTGRGYLKGCGTNSSALATGGNNPGSYTTATEEFTGETITQVAKTLSSS